MYDRYKLTGLFFRKNSYLNKYSKNRAGKKLAIYILKRAFIEINIKVLVRFIPDMLARALGMFIGKNL